MRIGIGHADLDPDAGRLHVAARAVTDALLGATGLGHGEAATREPESAGALDVLSRAVRTVEGENYQVVNVDLASTGAAAGSGGRGPDGDTLRAEIADRLHVPPGHVSLQSDGGDTVTAVALLDRIAPMDRVHSALRAGG